VGGEKGLFRSAPQTNTQYSGGADFPSFRNAIFGLTSLAETAMLAAIRIDPGVEIE
jgi:hypothetical protein